MHWLLPRICIRDDGSVDDYVERYVPGWLLLQIGRTIYPNWLNQRDDGKRTCLALIDILRANSKVGYLVDGMCFENWKHITNYGDINFAPVVLPDTLSSPLWTGRYPDPALVHHAYQVLRPGQIQPGRRSNVHVWIPLVISQYPQGFGSKDEPIELSDSLDSLSDEESD